MNLSDWRIEYDKYSLHEEDLPHDPILLFKSWFEKAVEDLNPEPNAFILGTISETNLPQTRVVLLKEIEDNQFVFYSNYNSQKGRDIEHNPQVSMLFFFPFSQRQIRIQGNVTKLSRQKAIDYFATRPIESQVSAMASNQSSKISRVQLIEKAAEIRNSEKVACPSHWGGYAIMPNYFEFWQGQPGRLHDRIVYENINSTQWEQYRLAP